MVIQLFISIKYHGADCYFYIKMQIDIKVKML